MRQGPLPTVDPRPLTPGADGAARSSSPDASSALEATRSGSSRTYLVLASLAVALGLLLGWFLLRDPAAAPPAATTAAPPEAVVSPLEPPTTAVDPHPLRIDIVTSRRVWLRVTVDGRIAIERELPQGERLPFGADKSIVVRAGDAGAVSVWIGNVDQGPLGGDGVVVTRLFEAPGR